ncbi:MAG TPA: hypothetical protein VEI81_05520, partial [Methanoregula sp.]|nr:hypothetical protein [Methanoregula sp.]
MVAVVLALRDPSLTVKTGENVPVWLAEGVHVNVCVVVLKLAPEGRLLAEYVSVLPSGSVAVTTKLRAVPAVTDFAGIAVMTGAWFVVVVPAVTVMVAVVLAFRDPSLTVKTGENVPVWLAE